MRFVSFLHGQKFVIVVKAAGVQIVVKATKSNGEEVEVFCVAVQLKHPGLYAGHTQCATQVRG
jgi:hypothetical protein